METVWSLHQKHRRHGTAERETLNADLVSDHIRLRLEPASPRDEILHLIDSQLSIDHIKTFPTIVTTSARIHPDLDNTILRPPLISLSRSSPSVANNRRIRTAIDIHVHRILLRRIEILRIHNHTRKSETVRSSHMHKLTKRIVRRIIARSSRISHNHTLQTIDTLTKLLLHRTAEVGLSNIAAMASRNDTAARSLEHSHLGRSCDI